MTKQKLIKRWLSAFGQSVPKEIMNDHVIADNNMMWHIFTWGQIPCLEGNAARAAFDQMPVTEVIQFYGGYNCNIKHVSMKKKRTAKALDRERYIDIYVVAEDFSWTYVHTHEAECGPYFCMRTSSVPHMTTEKERSLGEENERNIE